MAERVKSGKVSTERGWVPRALGAAVFLCAVVPFGYALTHGYSQFDDVGMLEVDGYRGLGFENFVWMFTTVHMGHYQPLAWLSFAMEHTVFGEDAAVSHAVNLVVHGVNAVLVFVLGARLIGLARPELTVGVRRFGAMVAALVFAVHPLRVESVVWVTERRDVLSLCFYLLAVISYLRVREAGITKELRRSRTAALWLFFVLSLLAKAWGMTFFLVLLIVDFYPLRRMCGADGGWSIAGVRRAVLEKVPFAVVGFVWAGVAGMAASSVPGTSATLGRWGVDDRVFQAVYGLVFYWWKTIWPTGLSVLYELPREMRVTEPRVIGALVVLMAAGVVCVVMRRKWPALVAGLAAYGVIVSPVLGFFQSGIQLVADRYSYISMIPPAVVLGGVVAVWMSQRSGRVRFAAGVVTAAGVVGLCVLTSRQTSFWRDDEVLFGHAIASGQEGPILRVNYGKQVERAGKVAAALEEYQRATELEPGYGEAWYATGNALRSLGRFEEARRAYEKALTRMPDSWKADQALGLLLAADMDELEASVVHFRSAVSKIEGDQHWAFQPGPYITLAQALYDLGDVPGARRELEKALRFRETHTLAAAGLKVIGERR